MRVGTGYTQTLCSLCRQRDRFENANSGCPQYCCVVLRCIFSVLLCAEDEREVISEMLRYDALAENAPEPRQQFSMLPLVIHAKQHIGFFPMSRFVGKCFSKNSRDFRCSRRDEKVRRTQQSNRLCHLTII